MTQDMPTCEALLAERHEDDSPDVARLTRVVTTPYGCRQDACRVPLRVLRGLYDDLAGILAGTPLDPADDVYCPADCET